MRRCLDLFDKASHGSRSPGGAGLWDSVEPWDTKESEKRGCLKRISKEAKGLLQASWLRCQSVRLYDRRRTTNGDARKKLP
jgi:hypothetical protein